MKADLVKRLIDRKMVVPAEAILQAINVNGQRPNLPEQDDIITAPLNVVAPYRPVGKDIEECSQLALHRRDVAFIQRHPLRDHAARVQAALAQLEILAGIKRRGAFDPRVDRIRRDDVELFARGENKMPRVVVTDLCLLVLYDAVVLGGKMLGNDFRNERLDLADYDPLDAGMHDERACRHARAAADDEHRFGLWMY